MSFVAKYIRPLIFTRALQEQADTFRQYLLLGHYSKDFTFPDQSDPTAQSQLETHFKVSQKTQQQFVSDRANDQVLTLFDKFAYVIGPRGAFAVLNLA